LLVLRCDLAMMACHPPAALMTAVAGSGQLADVVRRVGVAVSAAGAIEAAPDVVAWFWRSTAEPRHRMRGWLARWLPWLRRSATVQGVTAQATVRMKKPGVSGYGAAGDPNAPAWVQVRELRQLHRQLEGRVGDLQAETRKETEAVRAELRHAVEEFQEGHRDITVRIEADKERAMQADARGILVVVFGVVLSGVPAGAARWPVLAWSAMAAAIAAAAWVGILVATTARGR
jgi:hypothetical protein